MTTTINVQFNEKNSEVKEIEKAVREELKEQGYKVTKMETLEIYFQPENAAVYYVATFKDGQTVKNDEALYL